MVTVRHGSERSHAELRARCEASPVLLSKGTGFVLYALMDFLVDQYFPIVVALEEDIAHLEHQLIGDTSEPVSRTTLTHIYRLKRELLAIKRAVAPNRDMRRLSAWAATIAVPTMIAGIYGMNFHLMPELDWWFGYPLALVVMAAACGALFAAFKRSSWL